MSSSVEPAAPERGWEPWTAPLALLAALGVAIVGGFIVQALGAAAGASVSNPPPAVIDISTAIQDLGFVLSAVYFAARVRRPRPDDFGLRPTRVLPAIGLIVLGYAVFLGASQAWGALLHINEQEKKLLHDLGVNAGAVALVAAIVVTCVIAPICEEFLFRGYIFTALRNWRGPWVAALITALAFGGIHAGSAPTGDLVPLAFLGFLLCLIYWRTRSLYPCIGLHALNNTIAFGVTEHWDWQIPVLVTASLLTIGAVLASVVRAVPPPRVSAG